MFGISLYNYEDISNNVDNADTLTGTVDNDLLQQIMCGFDINNTDVAANCDLNCFTQDEISDIVHKKPDECENTSVRRYSKNDKHDCKKCVCGGDMPRNSLCTFHICNNCGLEEEIIGETFNTGDNFSISSTCMGSYNTSNYSSSPIKVSGPGCFKYQKVLFCKTNEYEKTQFYDTNKQMTEITQSYKGRQIPRDVVKEAVSLYHKIQKLREIKRGCVRKSIMAACILRICEKHGIFRKRKVFHDMFDIQPKELSDGEKYLDKLYTFGKIKNSRFISYSEFEAEQINGFMKDYFRLLKIPIENTVNNIIDTSFKTDYFGFSIKLIHFTTKFRLAENSNPSSKCAGTIWIIASKYKKLKITMKEIEKKCEISSSTFKRFSKIVVSLLKDEEPAKHRLYKKLRHLFNKYQVPL